MNEQSVNRGLKLLLMYMAAVTAIYFAKPFLVPVIIAALLAMLLLPLSEKLEDRGWKKGLAVSSCVLLLVICIAIIIALLAWQISDMARDAPTIEKNLSEKVHLLRAKITGALGISAQQQQEVIKAQQASSTSTISSLITGAFTSIAGLLAHLILVLVYVFLFLYYRSHLKRFLLKIVPKQDQANTRQIVSDCRKVAQKYLSGLALMIGCLWVMYGIGFTIIGVENGLFFAVLCGLLEIVPFVGNLVGVSLTALMSLAQGGSSSMLIGILITYGLVQFIQSYLIEPLVVGRNVNLNPLFTIVALVLGELIWDISGMVLAIPLMAITKIICDHIESLKPYGYLLGPGDEGEGIVKKIKAVFKKK